MNLNLFDTLAHDDVGNKRFSSPGDIAYLILNLFCDPDLDHNTAIQSFYKTIQLMMMWHQTKFSCKRISSSENILKSHILNILSFTVTLTLKTANQSFWKIIWLMMIHHHTKFGSKRFCNSEDIWTNIHYILKFAITLTLNTTIPFLPKTFWLMIMYNQTRQKD